MRQRRFLSLGLPLIFAVFSTPLAAAGPWSTVAQLGTPEADICPPNHRVATTATPAASPAAGGETRVSIGGDSALMWGAGAAGVVLAHGAIYDAASWRPQAEAIADRGFVVLAVESIAPEAIVAGIAFLSETCGMERVALIGASAGGAAAIAAASKTPVRLDQLILLSATGDVSSLGDYPKLFVASEGEGMADRLQAMAESAAGEENDVLILPGSAHAQRIFDTDQGEPLLRAILDRLERCAPS